MRCLRPDASLIWTNWGSFLVNGLAVDVLAAIAAGSVLLAVVVGANYLRKRAVYTPRWRAAMRKGAVNASLLALVAQGSLILVLMHMAFVHVVATMVAAGLLGHTAGLAAAKAPFWKVLCGVAATAALLVGFVVPNNLPLYESPYALLLASVLMPFTIHARRPSRAEEIRSAF